MKIKTKRDGDLVNCDYLVVEIGAGKYSISESDFKGLSIRKNAKSGRDNIIIQPVCSNVIAIDEVVE